MINIVMITSSVEARPKLFWQSVESLMDNRSAPHHLTIVVDGGVEPHKDTCNSLIAIRSPQGASAARNIGASSIPKYRRGSHVMFLDDDVYMCPMWDERIETALSLYDNAIGSGHAHPFNHPIGRAMLVDIAAVISTVHMIMPWEVWDTVGFFTEPGGPGGSEDVDYCRRAVDKGCGLFVTSPQCVLHTGLTSSSGKPIVGADLVRRRNEELMAEYRIERVVFQ